MVTRLQYETEIAAKDDAVASLLAAEDRIAELEIELSGAKEANEELRQRFEWARASANRQQNRAAAANLQNEKLVAEVKGVRWHIKKLELERKQDAYHARQLEIMTERLKLIREVAAPLTSNELEDAWRTR